jgi:hypothetical protein
MTIVKFLRNLPQDILYYAIVATVWFVNLFITEARPVPGDKRQQKPEPEEVMVGSLG